MPAEEVELLKFVTTILAGGISGQVRSRAYCFPALSVFLLLFSAAVCWGRQTLSNASIRVFADQPDGPFPPVWNYFGYDEPNYTYAANGQRLLGELAALSAVPVYVRTHNLLTSGDGSASLKCGSTNVYTEDASGK